MDCSGRPKSWEDIDVAHKDRAARIRCENATLLTGTEWRYIKVPQTKFDKLWQTEFGEHEVLAANLP